MSKLAKRALRQEMTLVKMIFVSSSDPVGVSTFPG